MRRYTREEKIRYYQQGLFELEKRADWVRRRLEKLENSQDWNSDLARDLEETKARGMIQPRATIKAIKPRS